MALFVLAQDLAQYVGPKSALLKSAIRQVGSDLARAWCDARPSSRRWLRCGAANYRLAEAEAALGEMKKTLAARFGMRTTLGTGPPLTAPIFCISRSPRAKKGNAKRASESSKAKSASQARTVQLDAKIKSLLYSPAIKDKE